jgi:hypothetical protein
MSHPAARDLERFSVHDLPEARSLEIEAHLRACETCAANLRELDALREARMAVVPPDRFVEQLALRRARRTRSMGATVAVAVAMAAMVTLFVRKPRVEDLGGAVALKGSGVTVFRNRGGEVHALATDEKIRAGDALRVVLTLSRASTVAAWVVDVAGQVDRVAADGALRLPAGESSLPGSLVVDAPCLDLELVVVTDTGSIEDLEQRLRHLGGEAGLVETALPPNAITRRLQCE